MPVRESVIVLPCSSLEDLETRQPGEQAAELLAALTLPWHPWLLAQTGRLPAYKVAGTPIEELSDRLVLLPSVSREAAPAGWLEQLEADGQMACLITELHSRNEAMERALAAARGVEGKSDEDIPPLATELAAEFLALGLASLVVELIGHTMHYSSNVDRDTLETTTVAAAKAACEGDESVAEEKLQRAFDLLGQARDYYYPVDSYFLDISLQAPSVWGQPLIDRLSGPIPTNVLLTAAQVAAMASTSPESMATLRTAIEDRKTTLVGGEMEEDDQTLASLEAMLDGFLRARRVYEEHLGRPPAIFGRFQGGFSPLLPCLLDGLGFEGALLAAFDGSQLPTAEHARFRWEGSDGSAIDCLGVVPCDAGDAGALLQLADQLGRSMQHDHVATVLFASWPGSESEFYGDLWRASKRCQTLGRFVTLDEYFEATHGSDMPAMFDADSFRGTAGAGSFESAHGQRTRQRKAEERVRLLAGVTDLVAPGDPLANAETAEEAAKRLATAVCSSRESSDQDHSGGVFVANLGSQPRTICVAGPGEDAGTPDRYLSHVPGIGFGWQPAGRPGAPPIPLAAELLLRNEFFEIHINETTGGIGAIHDYRRRHNRLSQQLALRLPGANRVADAPAALGGYTRMVADEIRVTAATPACGEITSTGRLFDPQGEQVAGFRQSTRLVRGSRLVELAIELTDVDAGRLHQEKGYCAVRWAWRDEPSEIRRSIHGASFLTRRKRIAAADFLEVVEDDGRLIVLTAEPTHHVHRDANRLDTLLHLDPHGRDSQGFRLAIGIDVEEAAGNWAAEWSFPTLAAATAGAPAADGAWWFLCGSKSVRWTALGPLTDGRRGFFGRLQELTGRYVKTRIESFCPIRSARKTNLRGEPTIELPVRDGRIELQMAGYQWVQFEAEWEW